MLTKSMADRAPAKSRKYLLLDDDGLYLCVYPTRRKVWVWRHRVDGRLEQQVIGDFPAMPLSDARQYRDTKKSALRMGITTMTFGDVGAKYLERAKKIYSDGNYGKQERHLRYLRALDMLPIADIQRSRFVEVVQQVVKDHSPLVAERVAGTLNDLCNFAVDMGWIQENRGSGISRVLPKYEIHHFATVVDPESIGIVMRKLLEGRGKHRQFADALQIIARTLVRTREIRLARWEEVDFDTATWTIPAEHMKMRRVHQVPLSRQVIEILARYRRSTGYLFSTYRGDFPAPLSRGQFSVVLGSILPPDFPMTVHGFRAMGSSVLNNSGWLPDAIEVQLAHIIPGVRGVYNRTDYMDIRREMMQWYSDYLDAVRDERPLPVPPFDIKKERRPQQDDAPQPESPSKV